jgi:hypothetical protein
MNSPETILRPDHDALPYLLEEAMPFAQSRLWDLQRQYYCSRGIQAWQSGEVPHYVTSNPTIAAAYAETVFANWRDQQQIGIAEHEPFTILELGSGSGRFAYHFLYRLAQLCEQWQIAPAAFRYVLSDRNSANLAFWRGHPRFWPYFECGMLDMALFDVSSDEELLLQISQDRIGIGSLARPLAVIANYVFDSIPQDLFYLSQGQCHACSVTLTVNSDPAGLDAEALLALVQASYVHEAPLERHYQEPWLQALLDGYCRALDGSYLLFPAQAIRCLQQLGELSRHGLMLLTADKGEHLLSDLQSVGAPVLVRHGSFSLNVNYHAIKSWFERTGGWASFSRAGHVSIDMGCCLRSVNPECWLATLNTWRQVEAFSPDDFFVLSQHLNWQVETMPLEPLLAYLRLSRYDAHPFTYLQPRLLELAAGLEPMQRTIVSEALEQVWLGHFPLGEALDVALLIAELLYALDDYRGALHYFASSIEYYGADTGTLSNMAACHRLLGQEQEAESLLAIVRQSVNGTAVS